MSLSTPVQSMGWTRRNVGVTVLLAMEEHRKQAGQRLAQLRDAKGWSQEDLSRETGLSVKTISRFENGRHDGRRDTIRRIVEAVGVSEADLVGQPPDPLGLGEPSQLDRIEGVLTDLLERVEALQADNDALRLRLSAEILTRGAKREVAEGHASDEARQPEDHPQAPLATDG